jgi:AraC-like DNA-binding protein
MERAADRLTEGTLTVEAVAAELGYEDPFYFSRVFREHFGRSPAQFRDAAGSESPAAGSAPPWPRR